MKKLRCEKCKHEWVPRTDDPKACPNCKATKKYAEFKVIEEK